MNRVIENYETGKDRNVFYREIRCLVLYQQQQVKRVEEQAIGGENKDEERAANITRFGNL